jgi:hypothetical protein
MIIPLNKLIAYKGNRYVFTRAAMNVVDKLGNVKEYPEEDTNWKVVPNILDLMFDGKINYTIEEEE